MLHDAVPQLVDLWNTEVWIPNCKGGTYCINAIEPENFIYSKVIQISSNSDFRLVWQKHQQGSQNIMSVYGADLNSLQYLLQGMQYVLY